MPPIIPPMYGPKYGIILVIPTITLISIAYGNLNISIAKKQIIPIISESIAFPMMKPENILALSLAIFLAVSAVLTGTIE